MKPPPAPEVPGTTEYERFDSAVRLALSKGAHAPPKTSKGNKSKAKRKKKKAPVN